MKRFLQFIVIFLCFMLVAYGEPIAFPNRKVASPPKIEKKAKDKKKAEIPYGKLPAKGFASLIGKNTEELTKHYGEPIEIQETALGYSWWILGEDEKDYLQVAVKNQKIASIFVLGQELPVAPFKIGMSIGEISNITTIFSNFDFEKKGQKYKIELTEKDMSYRPLVAFDNESFAILHLNERTGKIIGVRYLDKSVLLRLMPYELHEGELVDEVINQKADWALVNSDSERQFQTILGILRKRDKHLPYVYSKELIESTQKAVNTISNHPEKIFDQKNRLEEWQAHENSYKFNDPLELTTKEQDKLLKSGDLDPKKIHSVFYSPAYDVPFLLMSWYSDILSQDQLTHVTDKEVGVAFSKDVVLFVILDEKVSTKDSSSASPNEQNKKQELSQERDKEAGNL